MKLTAIIRAIIVGALVLADGCTPRVVQQTLPEPPPELTSCRQDGFSPPAPLPRLRTVEQVAKWASSAELARQRTQAELMECARRLDSLHQWIEDHRAAS